MAFQYPPSALACIGESLKQCFQQYDGNQLTVKCMFNGCWKAKELADRAGLNINFANARRDPDCPRTIDQCVETITPLLLTIEFQIYIDTCHGDNAWQMTTEAMALVEYVLCQCANSNQLPFQALELSSITPDVARDSENYSRTYRRLIHTWLAKTEIHACQPGALPSGCTQC